MLPKGFELGEENEEGVEAPKLEPNPANHNVEPCLTQYFKFSKTGWELQLTGCNT